MVLLIHWYVIQNRPRGEPKRQSSTTCTEDRHMISMDKGSGVLDDPTIHVSKRGEGAPLHNVELTRSASESIFGAVAADMVSRGWSVFPQENSGDRRVPGRVYGKVIRWSEDHDLANRRPSKETISLWSAQCDGLNVACVFGPSSGDTFAIDIDVMDEKMAADIVDIAEEILGPTVFKRVGRAPKIALIYRHEKDVTIPSTARRFVVVNDDGAGGKGDDGLEILSTGKLLTFHGYHHKTGRFFRWIGGATPLIDGPEKAPLVTADQLQTFLEAVDSRYPFFRGTSFDSSSVTWQWDEKTKLSVPRLELVAGGSAWKENESGLVCDGREAYLSSLVYRSVTGNIDLLNRAMTGGKGDIQKFQADVAKNVEDIFKSTSVLDQRWSGNALIREIRGKTSHLVNKIVRGELSVSQKNHSSTKKVSAKPGLNIPKTRQEDEELTFLRPFKQRRVGAIRGELLPPPDGAPSLDIETDRSRIASTVQTGLRRAFTAFLDDVYREPERDGGQDGQSRVHIIKAPTGAGKTSLCLRVIAEDQRTYEDFEWMDPDTGQMKSVRAPYVMLLPTYQNIDELRSRAKVIGLDQALPDAELRAQAEALGLMSRDDENNRLDELRRDAIGFGLKTMVYSGKLRAGCLMHEKVKLLMAAGLGTSSLCRAKVKKEQGRKDSAKPVYEEVFCEHFESCPVIAQRNEINDVHIVFMPHSFLSLAIPDELKCVRAIIADERIHHMFLHTNTFSASSLKIARKPPYLTRAERANDVNPIDFLSDRDLAAQIALEALSLGECPAGALFHYGRNPGGGNPNSRETTGVADAGIPGLSLVRSALRVCGDVTKRDGKISPDTSMGEIVKMCSMPTGRDIREEWQFWKIIEERIEALAADAIRSDAIASVKTDLSGFQGQWDLDARLRKEAALAKMETVPVRAKGSRDFRVQLHADTNANGSTTESIRISWRTTPNWAGIPILLLDASAAPSIIAKIWRTKERNIFLHDIVEDTGKALNVKIVAVVNQTFSNSSIAASAYASDKERLAAAKNLDKVRRAISTVSGLYGHGRVVAGTSIILREVINRDWLCPENIDWCHFGAMRGLDMFKFHSAAISIGRMEPPIRTIDGLVAALTYDDDEPEVPYDFRGDGKNHDNPEQPLMLPMGEQKVRLRSGHISVIDVPVFPGKWGRLVQRQYREEELLQFVGRLRPVYREGQAPVWFALSSVLPEELIVDDIIHIDDLLCGGKSNLWDAVRQTAGVVHPDIISALCPAFRSRTAVRRAMEKAGFNPSGGEPKHVDAAGFAAYRYWSQSEETDGETIFIRAGTLEPEAVLRRALRDILGVEPKNLRCSWFPSMATGIKAHQRSPDAVDARIGTVSARLQREQDCLDEVGEIFLSTQGPIENKFDNTTPLFPLRISSGKESVSIRTASAYIGIEQYWRSLVSPSKGNLTPMLPGVSDASRSTTDIPDAYDYLGATVADLEQEVSAH